MALRYVSAQSEICVKFKASFYLAIGCMLNGHDSKWQGWKREHAEAVACLMYFKNKILRSYSAMFTSNQIRLIF